APHPNAERLRRAVEPQRGRPRRTRPHAARQPGVRRERLLPGGAAPAASQDGLPRPAGDARGRQGARARAGGLRRLGDARVGARARRDALHPLVPAADGLDRREARLLLRAHGRRHGDRRVLRQGAHPGRARRLLVPDGRHPGDLRGPRLHGVGPELAGLHPREPQWRAALHPHGVRVVDGRGARPQDPAAALHGRAVEVRASRAEGPRPADPRGEGLHDGRARAGVLPDRRAVLLRAPRPHQHGPDALRGQAAQGPRARRPLLRLDPRARAGVHARVRARAGQARRADQDPPQRGRPRAVRDRPGVRELERRRRPPAARDAGPAERRAPLRPRLPPAREALRRRQRLGQAQQLVLRHGHGRQPARAGRHPAREPPVPVLLRGGHRGGQQAPGVAARVDRLPRPGPPPRGQRGAAGDHLDLPGRRAREDLRRDRVGLGRRGDPAGLPRPGHLGAPAPAQARRRPQPHLAVRLHGQQVRVPRPGLHGFAGPAQRGAQHDRRGVDRRPRRAGRGARVGRRGRRRGGPRGRQGDVLGQQGDRLLRRQLLRRVARRGRAARALQPAHHAGCAAVAREPADRRGLREVLRALRARARGPLRGDGRAVRREPQHRGRDRRLDGPHDAPALRDHLPRPARGRGRRRRRHEAHRGAHRARRRVRRADPGARAGQRRAPGGRGGHRGRPLRPRHGHPGHGRGARGGRPARARRARHALAAAEVLGDPLHQV
ncbi:MAG: Glutamine synthetase type III, GlnN, partial [uncultured Phycisphaerae bacterium]